jgi:site-specific DNA recombinase
MRACTYLRISLDKTGDELGVTRQREDCLSLAKVRGWEVVAEYSDNDTSAAGKVKRPGFEQMMSALQRGDIDVVIAWNLDRLTRNRPDTLRLIELGQEKRLTIALARGSDLDMSTPMGRMMADQLAGWARYEIEQKSERHQRANLQRAEQGLPHKGRRAFGYAPDGMTIVEDEALILKELAHRFVSGWTYNELTDWLNDSGYKTAMGNQWHSVAVRQILTRKRYAGIREHNGVEYAAKWPAIWDEDIWARVQHSMRERSAKIGFRPQSRTYLLTGLLFCGACGAPMNGTTTYDHKTREPRRTYRCNRLRGGCGKVSRSALPVDWWLRELICYRLDSPQLTDMLGDTKSSADLYGRQQALEAKLSSLLDDYADGTLTKTEYARAKSRVQSALDDVTRQIEQLHHDRTVGGLLLAGESVRNRWDMEADGWRRGLIDLLVERVTIQPSVKKPRVNIEGRTHYFDASALEVSWKV